MYAIRSYYERLDGYHVLWSAAHQDFASGGKAFELGVGKQVECLRLDQEDGVCNQRGVQQVVDLV